MKKLSEMTPKAKLKLANEYIKANQSCTKECEFKVELNSCNDLAFSAKVGSTFYCVDEVIAFARYHGAHYYISLRNGQCSIVLC